VNHNSAEPSSLASLVNTMSYLPGVVSVIMPVYCGEPFICRAIESVLNQEYRDFELIVVNDGSPDGSKAVIERFLRHPLIKYVEQRNGGVAAARNTGISLAQGEFIALLDQDDSWLPCKLNVQLRRLRAAPDAALVHSWVQCIDENDLRCSCTGAVEVLPLQGNCVGRLILGNGIAALTVVVRRIFGDQVGWFNQQFAPADDWELWLRLARRYPFLFVDEITAEYRVHAHMVSNNSHNMHEAALSVIDSVCDRYPDVVTAAGPGEIAHVRARCFRNLAFVAELRGATSRALEYWRKVHAIQPTAETCLALMGVGPIWRRRLQLKHTTLARVARWYARRLWEKVCAE